MVADKQEAAVLRVTSCFFTQKMQGHAMPRVLLKLRVVRSLCVAPVVVLDVVGGHVWQMKGHCAEVALTPGPQTARAVRGPAPAAADEPGGAVVGAVQGHVIPQRYRHRLSMQVPRHTTHEICKDKWKQRE